MSDDDAEAAHLKALHKGGQRDGPTGVGQGDQKPAATASDRALHERFVVEPRDRIQRELKPGKDVEVDPLFAHRSSELSARGICQADECGICQDHGCGRDHSGGAGLRNTAGHGQRRLKVGRSIG